ncbi:hypothetical protein EL22_17320 [Halostagnicola sp. A56]|nr:hypothetical protein EL22_17320 [Halostagnicola sp. A56]
MRSESPTAVQYGVHGVVAFAGSVERRGFHPSSDRSGTVGSEPPTALEGDPTDHSGDEGRLHRLSSARMPWGHQSGQGHQSGHRGTAIAIRTEVRFQPPLYSCLQ